MHHDDSPFALCRIDPSRNMARFYVLSLQPNLRRDVARPKLGRIGTRGREKVELFDTTSDAAVAMNRLAARKLKRGSAGSADWPLPARTSDADDPIASARLAYLGNRPIGLKVDVALDREERSPRLGTSLA
jgi:predicted DNA-binding WGR domain protein